MMRKMVAFTFTLALVSTPIVQAKAEDLAFWIWNDTSVVMTELYISPSNVNSWEEDVLGADVVLPGEGGEVIIADGRTTCIYDILGIFADGDQVDDYGVDLCTLEEYTFYEQ